MSERSGTAQPPESQVHERSVIKHRPLLSAAVAFAIGILAARTLCLGFWGALLLSGFCVVSLAALRRVLHDNLQSFLILLLAGAAGAATQAYHTTAAGSLSQRLGQGSTLCTICGTVRGETAVARGKPVLDTAGVRHRQVSTIRVSVDRAESNGRVVQTTGDVSVAVDGELKRVAHGDRVRVFGSVALINRQSPFGRYAASQGIVARMWVSCTDAVKVEKEGAGSFFRFLYAAKRAFRDQIDRSFPTAPDEVSGTPLVLKAVLLGDRARLSRRLEGFFSKSGTMHILAISGLHVAIVYAAVFWLCRILLVRASARRVIVLAVVISYALMTGLRPAIARATLMIVMFEVAGATRFSRDSINVVAATALIILAWAPQQLFEAGFQLTFVAVLGIILFARDIAGLMTGAPDEMKRLVEPERRSRFRSAAGRARKVVVGALGVCAAATLCVAPLQAYYFNIVTPVSIVATAVLVPVVSVLIALGFVFLALGSLVPVLALPVAKVIGLVAGLFTATVELASEVPFGHVFVGPPPEGWIWLFYGALLAVTARRWCGVRGARAILAPSCVMCLYLGWRALVGPGPELAATFVDAEHGMCAVITRGQQTVVFDCGSGTPFSTYDVGKGPAALELWRKGVSRIDLLVLSHTDADHVNGVSSLLDRFPVGRVVANATFGEDETGQELIRRFERRGLPFTEVAAGDRIKLPGLEIEVLWPPKAQAQWQLNAVNDRSLVARIKSGERSLLLTADIERAGMGGLLATSSELRAEVLYVPHHGAKEPVLDEFIQAVSPHYAVVSNERPEKNEWREVKRLLGGARVYHTFDRGNVEFISTGSGWLVRTER